MIARMNIGSTVQAISIAVFPWTCFGSGEFGRRRYLIIAMTRSTSTITNTIVPQNIIWSQSAVVSRLNSVVDWKVEFG